MIYGIKETQLRGFVLELTRQVLTTTLGKKSHYQRKSVFPMNGFEVLRESMLCEDVSPIDPLEVRQDVDQIYRMFDLERTIRFFGQKYWESESRFESTKPGRLQLENVAAHSFQVANTVILLGPHFPEVDVDRATKLAIVHDQLEMITGDKDPVGEIGDGSDTFAFNSIERRAKSAEETGALEGFVAMLRTHARPEYAGLIKEVISEETVESKFVKAIDKLQALTFVRIKKVGNIGPAHLSFTIRYSKEGVKKFPGLQNHFALVLSDILDDIERVFPADFESYCQTTCQILSGGVLSPKNHLAKVALIGKSGVGKSTVAKLLHYHAGTERISTGLICRQIAKLLFGNDDKSTTQTLDDSLTKIDPSIFLKAALLTSPIGRPICLDSLRFRSDYEIARQLGFTIVRVVAPDSVRISRLYERGQSFNPAVDGLHRSETELDKVIVDFEVENSGNIRTLETTVKALLG